MEIEHHQLDLRFDATRLRHPQRESRLSASLLAHGQRQPSFVFSQQQRFVLVDGYRRVRALAAIGRDTVAAMDLGCSEVGLCTPGARASDGDPRPSRRPGCCARSSTSERSNNTRSPSAWAVRSAGFHAGSACSPRCPSARSFLAVREGRVHRARSTEGVGPVGARQTPALRAATPRSARRSTHQLSTDAAVVVRVPRGRRTGAREVGRRSMALLAGRSRRSRRQ